MFASAFSLEALLICNKYEIQTCIQNTEQVDGEGKPIFQSKWYKFSK
ncbi:hypothetical protein [Dysgonomonas massiliensis]|nr:hypothetical protein [Dysgonomonas massiliensis]